jgi:mitochondrial chaperone BCS1
MLYTIFSRYGGTWIRVDRTREQQTLDLHMGIPWETVTLTSFGRNKQLYHNILEEGIIHFFTRHKSTIFNITT